MLKTISSVCARRCDWRWFKVVALFLFNFIDSTKRICVRNSALASWDIDRASAEDEGLYECVAQSKAGQGRALTQLTVRGMSPTIAKSSDLHMHLQLQHGCDLSSSQLNLRCMFKTSKLYKTPTQTFIWAKHVPHGLYTVDNAGLMLWLYRASSSPKATGQCDFLCGGRGGAVLQSGRLHAPQLDVVQSGPCHSGPHRGV